MESGVPDSQLIEVVSQRCADRKLNETKRGSLRRRHRRFWPQIRRGTEFRGSIHDEPPEPPSSAMFFNYSTRHSLKTTRFTDTLLGDANQPLANFRRRERNHVAFFNVLQIGLATKHAEYRMSEHRQRNVPMPRMPTTKFVFVQSGFLVGVLEIFLDGRPALRDVHQTFQPRSCASEGEVVGDVRLILA